MDKYQISRDNGKTWWPIAEESVRKAAMQMPGPETAIQAVHLSGPTGYQIGRWRYRVEVRDDG